MLGAFTLGTGPLGGFPSDPRTGFSLTIGGVDVSGRIRQETLEVEESLGERTTARVELTDKDQALSIRVGDIFKLVYNGLLIFAGTVDRWEEVVPQGVDLRFVKIDAADWMATLDRRLIADQYSTPGQTAGDIVREIIAEHLAAEGFSEGNIEDGVEVSIAVFPYVKASEAIRELADLTGLAFEVDQNKRINFFSRSTYNAPFGISTGATNAVSIRRVKSREEYKNRIYLRAGQAKADERVESFVGDGTRRTFNVSLPVVETPTIEVSTGGGAYVAKTVGIESVDRNKDFYWSSGKNEISQDRDLAALATNQIARVTYVGEFPLIMTGSRASEVAARAAIEGGTGFYDSLMEDEAIQQLDLAVEKLKTLLRQYAEIADNLDATSYRYGLKPGHIMPVEYSESGMTISDDYLVTDVRTVWNFAANRLEISIRATAGEFIGGWVSFFRKLEQRGKRFALRENEVVALGPTDYDNVRVTDTITDADPIDDGTNDPWTPCNIADENDPEEKIKLVDLANVGD